MISGKHLFSDLRFPHVQNEVNALHPFSKKKKKNFFKIYLFMRYTQREAETQEREKQAPCREPDVGLDLRTSGSRPEPKVDAQLLSCPGTHALNLEESLQSFSEKIIGFSDPVFYRCRPCILLDIP